MFKQPARLASMLALSACAARMAGAPPDRSTHFEWLRKQEIVHHTLYGSLARGATDSSQASFEPVARPVHPKSNRLGIDLEYFPLTFWGLNGGRLCFEKRLSADAGADPQTQIAQLKTNWAFVASTYGSVEEAGQSNDWPAAESVAPHAVALKEKGSTWHKDEKVAEICVAAPALAPPANFLVLTALAKGREESNFVLVWELKQ